MPKAFVIVLFLCFGMLHAKAQESQTSPLKKTGLEKMVQPKVSYESSFLSDAQVDSSDGSMQLKKNELKLNNAFVGLAYTRWDFKWSNVDKLPFGNGTEQLIKHMHQIELKGMLPVPLGKKWFWLNSLSLKSAFEKELEDSYSITGFSFASYKLDDDHTFQVGGFGVYHPVTSTALPIVSYSYRARKSDGFKYVLGFPRTFVGYHLNTKALLMTGFVYSKAVSKLAKESTLERDGYVETANYMSNIGLAYEFNETFTLRTDLLYTLQRDFTLFDSDGDKRKTYSIKPSLGADIKLVYRF